MVRVQFFFNEIKFYLLIIITFMLFIWIELNSILDSLSFAFFLQSFFCFNHSSAGPLLFFFFFLKSFLCYFCSCFFLFWFLSRTVEEEEAEEIYWKKKIEKKKKQTKGLTEALGDTMNVPACERQIENQVGNNRMSVYLSVCRWGKDFPTGRRQLSSTPMKQ